MAAGTEVTALAREGEQVLVPTAATAYAGEPVLQDAAGEELLDHRDNYRPPVAPAVREPLVVDGRSFSRVGLPKLTFVSSAV